LTLTKKVKATSLASNLRRFSRSQL